jgi:hypothetical protein
VTWNDGGFVGEGKQAVMDGTNQLSPITAGEIGASYGACKEGVTGK